MAHRSRSHVDPSANVGWYIVGEDISSGRCKSQYTASGRRQRSYKTGSAECKRQRGWVFYQFERLKESIGLLLKKQHNCVLVVALLLSIVGGSREVEARAATW